MQIRNFVLAAILAVPGAAAAQQSEESTLPSEPGAGEDVRTAMPSGEPQVEMFKDKDNWELRGTVASVDPAKNQLTLRREENLPPVQLHVAPGTEIKMDGKEASLRELEPGNEVRAKFNLANDQPLAIELDARPSREQKQMQREEERMQEPMNR